MVLEENYLCQCPLKGTEEEGRRRWSVSTLGEWKEGRKEGRILSKRERERERSTSMVVQKGRWRRREEEKLANDNLKRSRLKAKRAEEKHVRV